jgi:hypothetical protein
METLLRVALPPGLFSNGTRYDARGRWWRGSLVRWADGALRPVGGFVLDLDTNGSQLHVVGVPRGALAWRDNSSQGWIAVGTTGNPSKLYVLNNGVLTDITPAGLTNGTVDGLIQAGSPFGQGPFGNNPYGASGSPLGPSGAAAVIITPDTWSLDSFGQILVACLTADGKLYSSTPNAQAAQIANSPTNCRALVVTPERFLFALGAGGDPRLVQWPDQQSLTNWTISAATQAGNFPLQTSGRLVAGRRTARETLLWTDDDLWSAIYIGGVLVYAFQQRGTNCGLIGPNAACVADGAAYWMGNGQFFVYDGAVRPIPCEVRDTVFGDFASAQQAKVQAIPVPQFSEVWWFYPSASQTGTENDHYVSYNYRSGFWMTGTLGRAAGVGAGVFTTPQLWDSNGFLYSHEQPASAGWGTLVPYVESGPFELGQFDSSRMSITAGDRMLRVQRLISDELILGNVTGTIYAAKYPTDTETVAGPFALTAPTSPRITGRYFRLRLDTNLTLPGMLNGTIPLNGTVQLGAQDVGSDWRVGTFRIGVVPAGFR